MQPLHIKKDQLCVKKDTSASSTSISARRSERIFFDDPRSGPCALLLYITARLGLPAGFFTPGIKPLCANSRNFIRDIPNLRMYPRGRPSIKSRFFNRSGRASKGSLRKPS